MKDNGNNHVNNDVNNSVNDNANNYGNNDDMKNNIHAGKNTADGSFTEKDAGTGKGKMSGRRRASGPLMIVLVLAALIVLYNTTDYDGKIGSRAVCKNPVCGKCAEGQQGNAALRHFAFRCHHPG